QSIGDEHVVRTEDRRHRSGIGGESRLEHQGGGGVLERREAAFKHTVQLHLTRDRAYGAGSGAVRGRRLRGRRVHPWMVRQPEVVVRREVDDVSAVEPSARAGGTVERSRMQEKTVGLEGRELVLQVPERPHGGTRYPV